MRQLRKWLKDCVDLHGESGCSTTLSGERVDESKPPVLPTRVIDVGPSDGSMSPRLWQTKGASGHYTALSYCWGTSSKSDRSYLTTTETLEKHLDDIPWNLLPRTLQDAIMLTRAVGIRYLWVDSLCIIQDSVHDWEKESASMGTVYSQARLVIAATIGANAKAGLFLPQEYMYHPRQPSLCFGRFPPDVGLGRDALPLFKRGWTAQEWILARRVVFWTHERMCWRCRCQCVWEDGKGIPEDAGLLYGEITWIEVVSDYSYRTLTYQSDKFVALQGVVSEFAKKNRNDEYVMGVWRSNMAQELLWSANQADNPVRCESRRLRFPSWSWISHPGGVNFIPHGSNLSMYDFLQTSGNFSFSILEDFSIRFKTRSRKVDLHHPDTVDYLTAWYNDGEGWSEIKYPPERAAVIPSCYLALTETMVVNLFVGDLGRGLRSRQMTVNQEGLSIVFDALDYLSWYRKETVAPQAEGTSEFLFIEVMHLLVSTGSLWTRGEERVYGTQWGSTHVGGIAGLVLRKSHDTPGRFVRVGVAVAPSDWFQNAQVGEFIVE